MTDIDLDALLAYAISKRDIEDARALIPVKWWDYRFKHPAECFFLFHQTYVDAITRWRDRFGVPLGREFSIDDHPVWHWEREWVRGSIVKTGEKALNKKVVTTGLWRSMCICDSYGVTYDRWIEWAFRSIFDLKWKRLPPPAQLGSTRVVPFAIDRWRSEQAELTHMPSDPAYLAQNYVGHAWQDEFQTWLLGAINARSVPEAALAHYLFKEPFVVFSRAREVLGDDVVRRASAYL